MQTQSLQISFAHRSAARQILVAATAAVLLMSFADHAAAEGITALGVPQSGPYGFEAPCNYGEVLSGIFINSDGYNFRDVSPQCVKASNPNLKIHAAPQRWPGRDIDRDVNWGVENPSCPDYAPVVLSIRVETLVNSNSEIKNFRFQSLGIFCGVDASHPSLEHAGGQASTIGGGDWQRGSGTQFCPSGQVAVGIHGRRSDGLDEIGLICGDPKTGYNIKLVLAPGKQSVDRNAAPYRTILTQSNAAGEAPAKTLGRVKLPPTGAPPRPICDVAREARARNSPAAPGLEAQCRADLAAKGAAIAQLDPIVAAARSTETDALYWQGFDIATAIFGDPALGAQGNTATGPGSLGIRDALSAAGQRGFNASVTLHLSRNYRP